MTWGPSHGGRRPCRRQALPALLQLRSSGNPRRLPYLQVPDGHPILDNALPRHPRDDPGPQNWNPEAYPPPSTDGSGGGGGDIPDQLSPRAYHDNTVEKKGAFVNHKDKVDEEKPSSAFEWTSKTYQEKFREIYSECNCRYCEGEPAFEDGFLPSTGGLRRRTDV